MSILQTPPRVQSPIPMQTLLLLPELAMSFFDGGVNAYDCLCHYASVHVHAQSAVQNHDVDVRVEFQSNLRPFPSRIGTPKFQGQQQLHNSGKFEVFLQT
jgi:hypothetical protein